MKPWLFGEGFTKKAKERDDELKCLNQATSSTNKASSSSSSSQKSNFFPDQAGPTRAMPYVELAETTGDKEAVTRGTIHTTKAGNATNQKPKNSSCDNGHKVAHSDVYFAKQKLFTQHYALSGDKKSVPNGD